MRKILAIAALPLALALVSGSALAADLSPAPAPMAPPPVTAISWGGFYGGVVGAYGWGNTTAAFSAPSFITSWEAVNIGTNGGLLGGTLGYNFDMHNWVLGIEGDISAGNIGGSSFLPATCCAQFNPFDTVGAFHQSYFGTVRGRIGWSGGGSTLWYATGGLAVSDGHREITNSFVGDVNTSATHVGWTVGAGVEHKITTHWSVKAELLYADLGTQHYADSGSGVVTDVHLTDTLARVGVNYKF